MQAPEEASNQRAGFWKIASAGAAFQAGSAAVDSATIMSALVFQLTGNPILVGAVPAILRFGWLFPQLFVGFLAARGGASMRYYVIGAFGRTAAIGVMAAVIWLGAGWPAAQLGVAVLLIWTVYAFVSGIVAVPYNDIVARSISSERRSRLLATRFFGGGVVALGVAVVADDFVRTMSFPMSYAAIFALAAALMLLSSVVFVSMGEPNATANRKFPSSFAVYFRAGIKVFRRDRIFRQYVFAQWCGGAVLMAAPFYVVAAEQNGISLENVAVLLAAQTTGALASNFLWGWWGDHKGKHSLLRIIALGRVVPPTIILLSGLAPFADFSFPIFVLSFFLLGAIANGLTIAVIGLLMEISPEDERPQYSGYFNAITAPAFLLPAVAGVLVYAFGVNLVFVLSIIAAIAQLYFVNRIGDEMTSL